ncbi:MAG TPA: hypothetical protein VKA25_10015 [Gemmatimonadales bacterium]|nr:hypothetical protein [Gemmatimonadales bacterium]
MTGTAIKEFRTTRISDEQGTHHSDASPARDEEPYEVRRAAWEALS